VEVRQPGHAETALRVWLDPEHMAARSLTVLDIVDALRTQSLEVGAAGGPKNLVLTVRPKVADPDQVRNVIVKTLGEGRVVYLRDVARVELGAQTAGYARLDDRPAALVAVVPADDKALDAAIKQATKGLDQLPKGLAGDVFADLSSGMWSLVEVRLPDGITREAAERALAEPLNNIRGLNGAPRCIAFSDEDAARVRMLVKVAAKDAAGVRKAFAGLPEARVRITSIAGSRPFPVQIALADEGGHGIEKLREWANAVAKRLEKEGVAIDPDVFPGPNVSQTYVRIDREKAEQLGVRVIDIADTLQAHGGIPVSDFKISGRTWQVIVQVDEKWKKPQELGKLPVRAAEGKSVALDMIVSFERVEGPPAALRVNRHPAVRITADAPHGKTVAEVAATCAEIAEVERKALKLPDAFKVVNLVK
jgi:multidrug efflux pump subunit AcrB